MYTAVETVEREMEEFNSNPVEGVTLIEFNKDKLQLVFEIYGPLRTPFRDRVFKLRMSF